MRAVLFLVLASVLLLGAITHVAEAQFCSGSCDSDSDCDHCHGHCNYHCRHEFGFGHCSCR